MEIVYNVPQVNQQYSCKTFRYNVGYLVTIKWRARWKKGIRDFYKHWTLPNQLQISHAGFLGVYGMIEKLSDNPIPSTAHSNDSLLKK